MKISYPLCNTRGVPEVWLYSLVIGFGAGVYLATFISFGLTLILALICIAGGLSFASRTVRSCFRPQGSCQELSCIGLCILGCVLAVLRVDLWNATHNQGVDNRVIGKPIELLGTLIEEPDMRDQSTRLVLRVDHVTVGQQEYPLNNQNVLVTTSRYQPYLFGDRLVLTGKLRLPRAFGDQGGYDENSPLGYVAYLHHKDIFYLMSSPVIQKVGVANNLWFQRYLFDLKQRIVAKIDQLLPNPESVLLAGLLVSGRSSLDQAEQALFVRAGVIHIVALSGSNVTMVMQGLFVLIGFIPKRWRLLLAIVAVITFALLTGASATIVRATIMAILAIIATMTSRTNVMVRALALSMMTMMVWNPYTAMDISFQLSCAATFAMIVVTPQLNAIAFIRKIYEYIPNILQWREVFVSTIAIELFVMPLILFYMSNVSVVSIISNMLILPFIPIAMMIGAIALSLGFVSQLIALPLSALVYLLLSYIYHIALITAAIPFAQVSFSFSAWALLSTYSIIFIWLWWMSKKNHLTRW